MKSLGNALQGCEENPPPRDLLARGLWYAKRLYAMYLLYRLYFKRSLCIIPKCLVLDSVKSLTGDGDLSNKISSIFDLPIIDEYGNLRDDIRFGGIPPAGEIARSLFNIALIEIFDR